LFEGDVTRTFRGVTAPAARARPKHRWIIPERPNPEAVARLQAELHLPEPLCPAGVVLSDTAPQAVAQPAPGTSALDTGWQQSAETAAAAPGGDA